MTYGQPDKLPFRPELTGALAAMEQGIEDALEGISNGEARADIPVEIAAWTADELWCEGKMDSLGQFEACLREIGSKLYCLAVPAYAFGEGEWAVNPADGSERQFGLVLVNDEDEAASLMQQWEMSSEENMNRLALAGIRQRHVDLGPAAVDHSSLEP